MGRSDESVTGTGDTDTGHSPAAAGEEGGGRYQDRDLNDNSPAQPARDNRDGHRE